MRVAITETKQIDPHRSRQHARKVQADEITRTGSRAATMR
jgi:hypothetical protein